MVQTYKEKNKKITDKPVRYRNLVKEFQVLMTLIPTFIIISVQLVFLAIISDSMIIDLKTKAMVTAEEACAFLQEPLYNLDQFQAIRICEVFLSSGRILGINLESAATGTLLQRTPVNTHTLIPSIRKDIFAHDIYVGSVEIYFSDVEIKNTRNRLLYIALITITAVFIVNLLANRFIVSKRIKQPIRSIMNGIRAISVGRYETPIQQTDFKDVNLLVSMINDMAGKIQFKNMELCEANNLLEERVLERTAKLENSLRELNQAQDLLIESEKLSALGQLSAGMAHELNTPLGAILSSNRTIIEFLDSKLLTLIDLVPTLDETQRILFARILEYGMKRCVILEYPLITLKKKKEFQALLATQEIPHSDEVAEILLDIGISESMPNLQNVLKTEQNVDIINIAKGPIIARRMAQVIEISGKKAAAVIDALRSYLALETKAGDQPVDIVKDLENVLVIMQNILKYGIIIERDFAKAQVFGSSDKLCQVWINLIRNAAQAMAFKGTLRLRAKTEAGKVSVSFTDTGCGIPEDIRDRVFEPFFSTKKQGEGMGLGLDICRKIIERHGGSISFVSFPGKTEFLVVLPSLSDA